jgi:hypothetical protein
MEWGWRLETLTLWYNGWVRLGYRPILQAFIRGLTWPLVALVWSHCALKIDDPVGNLQEKINTAIETSDSALIGAWVADSTYTLRDTAPKRLTDNPLTLNLYRDGRFRMSPGLQIVFPNLVSGIYRRNGDSLTLSQVDANVEHMGIVSLTFLGNYLRVYQPSQLRYAFFHKVPRADTASADAFLDSGFWVLHSRRDSLDIVSREKGTNRFEYLFFRNGKLRREIWIQGLPRADSGEFRVVGDSLWCDGIPNGRWVFEAIHGDTLRLWPLRQGVTDSGFMQFARVDSFPKWHRDLRPYMGYWRGDSLRDTSGKKRTEYESYFDLALDTHGRVQVFSKSLKLPAFSNWSLDSGRFVFTGAANGAYSMEPSLFFRGQDTLVQWITSREAPADRTLDFYGTKSDSTGWGQSLLARFPLKNHAVIRWATDSAAYLSFSHFAASPDRAEFGQSVPPESLWVVFHLPSQASISSSQSGFYFKMQGRDTTRGLFHCSSRSDLPLTLRMQADSAASTASLSRGDILGACHIDSSQIPAPDSVLPISGEYRIERKSTGVLRSRLW